MQRLTASMKPCEHGHVLLSLLVEVAVVVVDVHLGLDLLVRLRHHRVPFLVRVVQRDKRLKVVNALEARLRAVVQFAALGLNLRIFQKLRDGSARVGVVAAADFVLVDVVFALLDRGGELFARLELEQVVGVEHHAAHVAEGEAVAVAAEVLVWDRLEAGGGFVVV